MKENITTKIAIFKGKEIRKIYDNNEWWFSIVDIIAILTDSTKPRDYWYRLKKREKESSGLDLSTMCRQLKLESSDGKKYNTEVVNTENAFRIIQSIPSPKAEPFKQWLAKVGYERIEEIENPELAMDRMKEIYEKKGYPKEWIDKRARGIAIRHELTDEWKSRGAEEGLEYAILTNEIMRGTFDMDVAQYKDFKDLDKENLRDHMTDLELILTMLGETTTTQLSRKNDSQDFPELQNDAKTGGDVAGRARKDIEKQLESPVSSSKNFKQLAKKKTKKLKSKP